MAERLAKWSVTDGTVIGHMHYGLRVQIPSAEIGVVVRDHIADDFVDPADWPAIGSVITVVGAGYAGSQLRLSSRPSHLEQARVRMANGCGAAAQAEIGNSGVVQPCHGAG